MKAKKFLNVWVTFTVLTTAVIVLYGFVSDKSSEAWVAPTSADVLKNPFKGNVQATKEGKKLYMIYCNVCHGETGKGDGPAGLALNPRPADHSSDKVQKQSDGAIFWKITEGRSPMASYKQILTEEQRWKLVNYVREFAK